MRLAIIADDLTGAADTGVQFAKRCFYTNLLPFGLEDTRSPYCLRSAQVIALNTNTRSMEAKPAYDTVKSAVALLMQTLKPQSIYKKIDSTLRGNLGVEIEAVMDAARVDIAFLAPALPAHRRTTVDGIHFVHDQPLSRTEVASDPVNPVKESHVPTLIRTQISRAYKVGHIDLSEVRRGSEGLQRSVMRHIGNGERIIVFDAVTDDDLGKIAEAGISMPFPVLMVGSAGLANQLAIFLQKIKPPEARPAAYEKKGVIIIISGSLSAVTSKQLNEVRRSGKGKIIPIAMQKLIEDRAEYVGVVMSAMETSGVIGIRLVREDIRSIAPSVVMEYLGKIALQIVRQCPHRIRSLVLTGGDTAMAVIKNLGIYQFRLLDEVLPGIPYGQVTDGEFAGLTIVTKAGAFGDEDALIKCIDFLERV